MGETSRGETTSGQNVQLLCKLGVISQEQLKIEVKLLLRANRNSYNAAPIGTTTDDQLSDLEWPFHASRGISAVDELLVTLHHPTLIHQRHKDPTVTSQSSLLL